MAKPKSKSEQKYYIAAGFNIPDGDGGEVRYDPSEDETKPVFVEQKDFDAKVWEALIEMGAVVSYVKDPGTDDEE